MKPVLTKALTLLGIVLMFVVVALLGACTPKATRPVIDTVKVPVVQYRALPAWATSEVDVPPPVDEVGDHLAREHALELLAKRLICHRVLLRALDADLPHDPGICEAPAPAAAPPE